MDDSKKTKGQLVTEIEALRLTLQAQAESLHASRLDSRIIASTMDAIIVMDEAQNIVQFNASAEGVFEYQAAEVLGRPVHILFPEPADGPSQIQKLGETGFASPTTHALRKFSAVRASGVLFPVEASVSQATVDDRKYHALILRDVSERELVEDLILRQYDSLNTLHLVTLDLLNQRDIKDLLQFIVDEAVKLLEVSYCEILLPEGSELVAQAFTRDRPFQKGNRVTPQEGQLSWQVFTTGLPAVLDDYSTWPHRHEIYEKEKFHAAAALPLSVGNHCIGVLGLTRAKPDHKFSEEHILTATRLAAIAALAIENSRLYLKVKQLATTDELTGAHNRRSLMEIGEREAQRCLRYDRALSALMLDIDYFKRVNDTWGHATGDVVLRGITQESMRQIRKGDTIGRYAESLGNAENIIGRFGGEEFVILLPETSLEGARVLAERIRSSIAKMIFKLPNGSEADAAHDSIKVTASIGVSCLTSKTDGVADLLARADRALYMAKESGRNRVCVVALAE